jgi:hypothetical protein
MIDLLAKLKGVTKGADGWEAKCPAHGDKQASLSVAHRDGKWLLKCHVGCTASAICQAIGIELSDLFDMPKKGVGKKTPNEIFAEARPIDATFPYFPARGLDVAVVPGLVSAVRHAPALWHKESRMEKPALIAAATNGRSSEISTIQRLYLTGDRKAKACKPMSLGKIHGLTIRLGPATEILYIAEGLEDAATAMQADSGNSAWAALGASNMPNVDVPETTKTVVFLGQNDKTDPSKHDPTFARFAARAVRRLAADGKDVRIAWPPAGVKDINDLVRGKANEELAEGYARARAMLEGADVPPESAPLSRASWIEHALVDGYGNPLSNLANAMLLLRSAPEIADCFGYDEMERSTLILEEPPLAKGAIHANHRLLPRPISDADVTQVQEWMQHSGLPKIGADTVHQAVARRASENPFHPLRKWLDGLQWDGTPRLNTWLHVYLGAEDTHYHRAIGAMFLIAMAARVLEPGCKCDYVLILQGGQGVFKSAACQILADKWFADTLPDIKNKDVSQHIRKRWLVELPELSALSRGDVEAWKAFITRTTESYRPPYGRKEIEEPRQCVFAGTTNKEQYLYDETGNRRFWPAAVGKIDLDALRRDREQLFAEAVRRYRAGERWWPGPEFERRYIVQEQENRVVIDDWEGPIADYLDKIPEHKTVQVCEIGRMALGFQSDSQIGAEAQNRIRRILHKLGWRRGKRTNRRRFYERPAPSPAGAPAGNAMGATSNPEDDDESPF